MQERKKKKEKKTKRCIKVLVLGLSVKIFLRSTLARCILILSAFKWFKRSISKICHSYYDIMTFTQK